MRSYLGAGAIVEKVVVLVLVVAPALLEDSKVPATLLKEEVEVPLPLKECQ